MKLLAKLFDGNAREVERLRQRIEGINDLEPEMERRSDDDLRVRTEEFREQLRPFREAVEEAREARKQVSGPEAEEAADAEIERALAVLEAELDRILPEAFAIVREAGKRVLGMRHFDVQLIGGLVLHQGRIAEMATGEGKTLAATLPLYLNALTGYGGHLVTVNDYLAKRDACWMGALYHFLGLTVDIIQSHPYGSALQYTPGVVNEEDPHLNDVTRIHRRDCYQLDVVFGTNAEFGFDYLRDNMAHSMDELVQRTPHFAIVDEVDSILIDEARTPLIISGMPQESNDLYYRVDRAVARLQAERDYTVEEKEKTAVLTEEGTRRLEQSLGVPNLAEDVDLMHYTGAALKARYAYRRDIEYVVKDGQVVIVDEFTGRLMFGRRYSDGLHQAIEAKEGVRIEEETQTVATITLQNYFRLYHKLSGMTGTAKTEEGEFRKIYGSDVVVVPTNLPLARVDNSDVIYKTNEAKFRGVAAEILRHYVIGQPVLVGTRSIEVSEQLSERLKIGERLQVQAMPMVLRHKLYDTKGLSKPETAEIEAVLNTTLEDLYLDKLRPVADKLGVDLDPFSPANLGSLEEILDLSGHREGLVDALENGVAHSVLNAKHHEQEGEIIAEAGRKHAVTIATNMAGRGVDIILGGKPAEGETVNQAAYEEVKRLGGLAIIGSERHESRRIDRQLRGRSGRQGDPGESRFYLSLEDELWRLFGDKGHWALASWPEAEPLEAKLLTKAIERAQKKVEERNFGIRKHTLEYDDVMNVQRSVIYKQRREILEGTSLRETVLDHAYQLVEAACDSYLSSELPPDEWDYAGLLERVDQVIDLGGRVALADLEGKEPQDCADLLCDLVDAIYADREAMFEQAGADIREVERQVTMHLIDQKWVEHLNAMEYLREGIHLRGYGQVDPLVAYKKESFELFEHLMQSIQDDMVNYMFHVVVRHQPQARPRQIIEPVPENEDEDGIAAAARSREEAGGNGRRAGNGRPAAPLAGGRKIGRNEPCPCGSGKKYKHCCLKLRAG